MGEFWKVVGVLHRGLPVTMFFFCSQSPNQLRWQLQLKGLDSKFLEIKHNVGKVTNMCKAYCLITKTRIEGTNLKNLVRLENFHCNRLAFNSLLS